jgi:hypothetical protein
MRSVIGTAFLSLALWGGSPVQAGPFDQQFGSLEDAKPDRPEVQWTQIQGWKNLGHRWAGALNNKGEVIAIYDLSYPNLLSGFPFAYIGGRKISKKDVLGMIWSAKFDPDADQKLVDETIEDLQKPDQGPIEDGALPKNWFKEIPWKKNRVAFANVEPMQFRISDMDLNSIVKKPKDFAKYIKQVEDAMNALEGQGFGSKFLDGFQFSRISEGAYQISWSAQSARAGVTKPKKIADLASTKVEFYNTMKFEIAKQALSNALDLIPLQMVQALVDTAVDRFFHFHSLVAGTHRNMVLEALNSAHDGTGALSNIDLTASEKEKAIEALSFAETSLWMDWKWIWKKPTQEWLIAVQKDQDKAKLSMDWLNQHHMKTTQLNPRFGFSFDPTTQLKKLVVLSFDKPNAKNGPKAAIDYSNLNANYNSRMFMEISTAAVVFGTHFIPVPYVGSLVKRAFKQFVEKPYKTARIWEGRLSVHLEERGEQQNLSELSILDRQRLNPLFPSRQETNDLIAKRRQLIGLQ